MNGYLAAYDPASRSTTGDYWIWKHNKIPPRLLSECYSFLAKNYLPDDPNLLAGDDCHGGCLALEANWCCFYRFFNGGRDLQGRPGRFAVLVLITERREALRHDCSEILDSEPFALLARQQPLAGSPLEPRSLKLQFDLRPLAPVAQPVARKPQAVSRFTGQSAMLDSWRSCSRYQSRDAFHWRVYRQNGQTAAEVHALSRPASIPSAAASTIKTSTREHFVRQPNSSTFFAPLKTMNKPYFKVFILIAVSFLCGFLGGYFTRNGRLTPTTTRATAIPAMLRWFEQHQAVRLSGLYDLQVLVLDRHDLLRRIRANDWSHPDQEKTSVPRVLEADKPHGL